MAFVSATIFRRRSSLQRSIATPRFRGGAKAHKPFNLTTFANESRRAFQTSLVQIRIFSKPEYSIGRLAGGTRSPELIS